MLSGAATVAQTRTMAQQWLLSDAGFCLTGQNESHGSNTTSVNWNKSRGEEDALQCDYGLPSIAHSGELILFTVTFWCESCSQFDLLPLIYFYRAHRPCVEG